MQRLLAYLYRKKLDVLPNLELGKFPPIGWIRDRMRRQMRKEYVEIDGHKLHLDPNDTLDLSINPSYERALVELMGKTVKPGATAIDVGANIGYFSLILARLTTSSGHVYSFEPAPENFALLKENIEANGYGNVTLVNKAVSNHSGPLKLFLAKENLGDHRIFDSGDNRESALIEAIRLDDFFADNPPPIDVIKMDIQGAEFLALQGMEGLLDRSSNLNLFMEFWPYGLRRSGTDPEKVIDFLQCRGFSIREVSTPDLEIKPEKWKRLIRHSRDDSPFHTDLFCLKLR